ncbi:MAG: glycosyltransferase family 2 protein [Planctomycetota bacterium]|jgi:hypothetical protein
MSKIIRKDQLPPVCINLLTKDRTDYAVTTVKNALDKLHYDGHLDWYVSDGGSSQEHLDQVLSPIPDNMLWDYHSENTNPGACWNIGIREILKEYDIYLRLEDDMVIKSPMDITVWVKLLMTQWQVGMVRLGQIVIDLNCYTVKFPTYTHVGYTEEVYLAVYRRNPYAFSGHPALFHKRFHDIYGMYPEGLSPGKTEVAMDTQIKAKKEGPLIVFPYDMGKYGTWGNWDHIGKEKST